MTTIQQHLAKTRKPRVHIQYEVETDDGVEQKELPFVVGVMGDYCGDSLQGKVPLKEREFIEINKDNFNQVMQSLQPELNFRVNNALDDGQSELAINLKFNTMEDFEPESIVQQVPVLNSLFQLRYQLKELLSKTDCSYELEEILESVLQDPAQLNGLCDQLKQIENKE